MGALRVSTAARRVVRAARSSSSWSPAHELTATMALKIAAQLDSATASGEVVRLTRELGSLMASLPDGTAPAPQEPGEEAAGDDVDAELAAIVGSGPEVGNPAHA